MAEPDFEHPPLDAYLDATIANLLATWPPALPPGYAQRDRELSLAARRAGAPA